MPTALKKLREARNLADVLEVFSWDVLHRIALVPAFLFFLSPLLTMLHNCFQFWLIESVCDTVNLITIVTTAVVILLSCLHCKAEGRSVMKTLRENPAVLWMLGFIVLILLSVAVNNRTPYTMQTISEQHETFFTYILYATGYFGCSALAASARLKQLALRVLQISSVVQVLLVFIDRHFIKIELLHRSSFIYDITSLFYNRNYYSYFLTVAVLLSAALFVLEQGKKARVFDGICFLLNAFTLMRANTLGCFLAGFCGMCFLTVLLWGIDRRAAKRALGVWGIYLALFALNSFFTSSLFESLLTMFSDIGKITQQAEDVESAGNMRWGLWMTAFQCICEHPLLGMRMEEYYDLTNSTRPHNEYLQYAAFFGIPAVLCYIGALVCVLLRGIRRRRELDSVTIAALTAAFGYMASAFFGVTKVWTTPYFFCVLGFAYTMRKEK